MRKTVISVVIPTWNAASYLPLALNSIVNQNHSDVEVIIQDGMSTDNVEDVVAEYSKKLPIKFNREPDRGQLDAVLKGFKHATGEIYYWLNADDLVAPGAFHHVVKLFDQNICDVVFSDDYACNEDCSKLFYGSTIRRLTPSLHLTHYMQMYSECVFWKSSIHCEPDPSFIKLRLCTDYGFFCNLIQGRRLKWSKKRLGVFRIREGQISGTGLERLGLERSLIKAKIRRRLGLTKAEYQNRKKLNAIRFKAALVEASLERLARRLFRIMSGDEARQKECKAIYNHSSTPV